MILNYSNNMRNQKIFSLIHWNGYGQLIVMHNTLKPYLFSYFRPPLAALKNLLPSVEARSILIDGQNFFRNFPNLTANLKTDDKM